MDSADDEDSINRIRLTQENLYGKEPNFDSLDKFQGVIIRLRTNENAQTSKNKLIAMLEELLRIDDAENKKRKLEEEYGISMTVETERKVNTMCNLSEVMLERGIEQGIERGIERGIEKGIERGIEQGIERGIEITAENMLMINRPLDEIEKVTGISQERLLEIRQKLK